MCQSYEYGTVVYARVTQSSEYGSICSILAEYALIFLTMPEHGLILVNIPKYG